MAIIYNEHYNGSTGLTVGLNKLLFSETSEYQTVEIYDTDTWGNLMTIDGMVMLSEKDEFVYHEMLIHPALISHPNPKRVLIIGGGDGGSAREALKHPSVEVVDMVEIDETVVRASKLHMPGVGAFDNPRLNVKYEDGIAFVQNVTTPYDVIIIDGSDPVGPAQGLFQKQFFQNCYDALAENGILSAQTESPWVPAYYDSMRSVFFALDDIFQVSKMYLAFIPLYPAGMWSMAFASKGVNPLSDDIVSKAEDACVTYLSGLKYYNASLQTGAFALPNFVADIIRR
jgi:spermidine synthase